MADQSVLGEEDPGAAVDLFYTCMEQVIPLPVIGPGAFANPERPSVAAAEARTLPLVPLSSIEAVARARLLLVSVDAKLADVAALMSGTQLSLAVVCDLSGAVVGVISDTLLLHQLGLGQAGIFNARAGAVMAREFMACGPADSLNEVLAAMHNRGRTHVPVVDADNRPQGVIYARDGLRALLAAGNFEEAQLRDYVTGIG